MIVAEKVSCIARIATESNLASVALPGLMVFVTMGED
jgi:hypothetical protein